MKRLVQLITLIVFAQWGGLSILHGQDNPTAFVNCKPKWSVYVNHNSVEGEDIAPYDLYTIVYGFYSSFFREGKHLYFMADKKTRLKDKPNIFGSLLYEYDMETGKVLHSYTLDGRRDGKLLAYAYEKLIKRGENLFFIGNRVLKRAGYGGRKAWGSMFVSRLAASDFSEQDICYTQNIDTSAPVDPNIGFIKQASLMQDDSSFSTYYFTISVIEEAGNQRWSHWIIHRQMDCAGTILGGDSVMLNSGSIPYALPVRENSSYLRRVNSIGDSLLMYVNYYYYSDDSIVCTVQYYNPGLQLQRQYDVSRYISRDHILARISGVDDQGFVMYTFTHSSATNPGLVHAYIFNHKGTLLDSVALVSEGGTLLKPYIYLKDGQNRLLFMKSLDNKVKVYRSVNHRLKHMKTLVLEDTTISYVVRNFSRTDDGGILVYFEERRPDSYPRRVLTCFTPESLGLINSTKQPLGRSRSDELRISPNPFSKSIVVDLGRKRSGVLELYDMRGLRVGRFPVDNIQKVPLNLDGFPSGHYTALFMNNSASPRILSGKLVKK